MAVSKKTTTTAPTDTAAAAKADTTEEAVVEPVAVEPTEVAAPEVRQIETKTVLFQVTGFTAFGKVWEQGEELVIDVGSDQWNSTLDRNGVSWVDRSAEEQIAARGHVIYTVS